MLRTAKCGRTKQSMPGVLGERMGRIPWDHWNSFHWRWGLHGHLRWQGEPCGCLGRAFQAEEQLVQNRAVGRYPACLMNWEPVRMDWSEWGQGDMMGPKRKGRVVCRAPLSGCRGAGFAQRQEPLISAGRCWGRGTKALSRCVSDLNYISIFYCVKIHF